MKCSFNSFSAGCSTSSRVYPIDLTEALINLCCLERLVNMEDIFAMVDIPVRVEIIPIPFVNDLKQ